MLKNNKQNIQMKSNKLYAVLFTALLLVGGLTVYHFTATFNGVHASPSFLSVVVSPSELKLSPNQTGIFSASVSGYAINYSCVWSARDMTADTFTSYLLESYGVHGEFCNFTFLEATENILQLTCVATDSQGAKSSILNATAIVLDPYTLSNIYLDALPSTVSFIIEEDGLGWYHAVNGSSGQTLWESTNPETVLTSAIGDGAEIYVAEGRYLLTSFVISADNFTLRGNRGNTVFYTSGDNYLAYLTQSRGVVIEDITFEGDGNTTNTLQTLLLVANGVSDLKVRNCKFFNSGYDDIALLYGVTNTEISSNYHENTGDDAVNVGGGGGGPGAYLVNNTVVTKEQVNGTILGAGIHLSTNSSGSLVTDNVVWNGGEAGISYYNSENNTIALNKLHNCTNGIKGTGGTLNIGQNILNNQIYGATGSGSSGNGIVLSYTSTNSKVEGNTIYDFNIYGIWVLSSNNASISSNTIIGSVAGGQGIRIQTCNGTFLSNNNFRGSLAYGMVFSNDGYGQDTVLGNLFHATITYNGIKLNHANSTLIGNVFKGTVGSWCIGEYGAADGNRITETDSYGQTFGILTIGASSLVYASFNGTTRIP